MKIQTICVLGGTGFVGRHLVARLANRGYEVKVLTRYPHRHRELEVLSTVALVGADPHDPAALREQFSGCDAVINLIGILHQSAAQSFKSIHAELPAQVARACQDAGVKRLLHMSALQADASKGPSEYLRSKGAGEQAVLKTAGLAVTCFKPSIIFAPDDSFFNQFATLLRLGPVLPLACPNSRFAPVYVEDVAAAFEKALSDDSTIGQSYELCGPRVYTFKELVEDIARMIGKKRWVVGLPDGLARLQARIFEKLPVKIFTSDNYLSLQVDSVCACNGFAALGLTPHSVEGIMPAYFADRNARGRYHQFREAARRS